MMNFPEGHKLRQDLKKFIRSLVFIIGVYVFNIGNAAAALTANNDIYGIPMNVISTPDALTVETLGVLANDAENGNNLPDPPGVLTAVLVTGVSSGTLTCSTNAALQLCPDGSFNYRPDVATFQGVDSFTYNLVNSSTSETSPVPATVTLTACNTTGTVTTCWHETPYLEMLATLGYNMFRESFEGSIWNTVRSPNAAASVTSKNISWTTNHTATNVLTTSVDVARSGSWGVYDQDHGFSDGTPGVCDVNNPPANCFPYDGFTGSGTSLNAVGGYISGNAAGNISILLDGIQTDIGKSPSAGHQFFGIIDTAGFSTFQFREMDGKIGQTFSVFGDDFVIGTTAQTDTNIAPVLTAIGNQTINEGVSFAINLSATDSNDGDTWSFSADALPAGASFVDNADGSARFNWIPGYTQQGTYTVTFTVTDNGLPALSHSETITIIVNDINRSPYLYPIGNKTVDDGVLLSFQLRATDADGNGLSFTSTALPAGATLVDNTNGTASFNWTPTASQVGTSYPITFTVTDNGLPAPQSDSESINILVTTPDIVPPVVTAPASIIVPAVNAAGAPSSHPLITAFLSGASAQDDIDGVITNITNNGPVQYLLDISTTVVFSATDSSNNTGIASATVTVSDLSRPVITLLGSNPLSINEGTVFSDPGSTVSDNVDTGLVATVTGSVNANVPGSYTLNYNVSDSAGNAATQVSRSVNVRDITRPVITLLGSNPLSINEGTVFSDPGSTVSDNVDTGLVATVTGSVNANVPGSYTLNYNVSDSAGNAAAQVSRSVNVRDITRPVISLTGQASITLNINAAYSDQGATASDNVDGNLTTSIIMSGSVDTTAPGVYVLTYNVSDSAGNAAIAVTRSVTVQDAAAPVVSPPASITVAATDATGTAASDAAIMAFLNGASAIDDVDTTLTISNNAPVQFPLGVTSVVFSATDSSNNTGTASATVTVSDLARPVISLTGQASITLNINAAYSDQGATASDNVDGNLTTSIIMSGSVDTTTPGVYILTYNVSDSAGNAAIAVTRSVTVQDAAAPVVSPPASITVAATDASGTAASDAAIMAFLNGASAIDDVDTTLTISNNAPVQFPLGTTSVVFSATDSSNNTGTASATVTVSDLARPVISLTGQASITLNINAVYSDQGATASDNVDGNLTTLIIMSGSVDTTTPGVYVLTYNVSDSAGNAAIAVTRSVTVQDAAAPVVSPPASITVAATDATGTAASDAAIMAFLNGASAIDDVDTTLTISNNAPVQFPLGTTSVVFSATDSANNIGSASAAVTVSDLTRPVITLLGSNPLSINEGTVFSDPGSTVSDNVDTGLVATVTGSVNANVPGSYTLNYNVSDSAGNAATQVSRSVNVRDITRPVISLTGQASITLNINAVYSDQGATASDNVDGNLTTLIIMSGSVDTTTPGVYVLTYNVSDSAGNAAIAVTRSVTVQDAAAPVVSPPASITVAATDATGTAASDAAIMAFLNGASAIDDVDTTLTISNNAPVQFPLGTTSVVFSATDSANNIGSASAAVTVSDLTRPVITLLGSNPLSINEGTVFSDPGSTVSDNVDTGLVATVSGSVNNSVVGIYTLNYNVVDAAGNAAITQTREVHVVAAVDTTPPVIDLLGVNPVSIEQGMLYDDAGATASDNVDTTITVITSGTVNTSVVGSYTLSYNATDSSGNAASTVTRIVHVTLDATSPTISLLGNNPESVEQGSLYLDAGATANDNFDGDITADIIVNNSVDTSRVGNYTVTYNVSDAAGNQALQATRTVYVTAPPVQNLAPVVTAPVDIVVAATGSVTSVNLGQAQVSDDHDTALVASANNPGPFKPGRYEIVWSATDSGNLTGTAVQVLEVQPIAEFMPDQYVESGQSVNVRVALNGQAAVYPVTIYYDVTANGISIPGAAGSLAITQGSAGVINYTVPGHIQTGDITFNMTAATNAVIGAQSSHVLSVISDNMEPLPLIEVTQNGKLTRIVTTDGGAVTVKAIVSDSNAADSHSYDWSKTDNVLLATGPGANDAQFLIDPASLTEQFYKIGVKVTDSGVPALDGEFELYIKVLSTAPVLSAVDSDGDGVNDDVEGIADDDQDGIPNYIDGVNNISLLQGRVGDSNKWLINVQSGLGIRLGQFSLLAGQHNANISAQDIQNRAGSIPAAIANATDDHNNVGGYFDFEITGLSRAGQSVQLVIPLYAVIPENAVYRKYSELNGWSNFVENNHNKLYSAPGQAGVCPAPGSSDYTEGLAPGSYCVQLLIEDGGPNDSDAKRNGSIADPGGVGVKNTTPASTPGSAGGGGSIQPAPLMILLGLYVMGLVIRAVNTWPLKNN